MKIDNSLMVDAWRYVQYSFFFHLKCTMQGKQLNYYIKTKFNNFLLMLQKYGTSHQDLKKIIKWFIYKKFQNRNQVKPVLKSHHWDKEKAVFSDRWPLKIGSIHMKSSIDRIRERWPFNTGNYFIEVTTWADLTVHVLLKIDLVLNWSWSIFLSMISQFYLWSFHTKKNLLSSNKHDMKNCGWFLILVCNNQQMLYWHCLVKSLINILSLICFRSKWTTHHISKWTSHRISKCTSHRISKCTSHHISKWTSHRISKWTSHQISKWTSHRTSKCTSHRTSNHMLHLPCNIGLGLWCLTPPSTIFSMRTPINVNIYLLNQ